MLPPTGSQTLITPSIAAIASSFSGDTLSICHQIIAFLAPFPSHGFSPDLFRRRTADQIISSGFTTGCTDTALAFIALARAAGIDSQYVETIDLSWLGSGSPNSISGHQYARCFVASDSRWIWVDPMGRRVDIPAPDHDGRAIFGMGLDSWDLGITDFDSLQKKFHHFQTTFHHN